MRRVTNVLGIAVLLGLGLASRGAAPVRALEASPASATARADEWREDLDTLVSELPRLHKNAFFRTSRDTFMAHAAALSARLPEMNDAAIVVELMRLVALLGDGHTTLDPDGTPYRQRLVPMLAYEFSDGLFVVAADSAHVELIGRRVLGVGGVAIHAARARLATTFPHENAAKVRYGIPFVLSTAEVLAGLGLAPDAEHARYTLAESNGSISEVELAPLADRAKVKWITPPARDSLPLRRKPGEGANWSAWLENERVVYCCYDRCADEASQPVSEFCRAALALVDEKLPRRVVIDLRHNGGGNSDLLRPLITGLAERRKNLPDGVAVLIGRRTFSSAQMNAVELRDRAHAFLVGEPTGQKPNAYGEVRRFTLPHSGIAVTYSTKYFKTEHGNHESTMPDVKVEVASADWFAGRDPVLTAALAARRR